MIRLMRIALTSLAIIPGYLAQCITSFWRTLIHRTAIYWHQHWWHKLLILLLCLAALSLITTYSLGQWYIWNERNRPLVIGTSFVADYAASLGLNPHQTLTALLDDLHAKHLRLVSYWSDIEPTSGKYDFRELDWEFKQAETHNAKVTLAIGLRQPRWPECHMPTWAENEPTRVWQPQLMQFMTAVINRYKTSPSLDSYQLENEYFLTAFASCADESRNRLVDEANLVHKLDPAHTLIISRSQNALGWPTGKPKADEYGISIYQRVWTPALQRYIEYPFPAWYYAFLAAGEKLWSGRDTMIHELQAEPWPPHSKPIESTPLTEQDKSFNAERLRETVAFGKATGMKTMDLWGSEYWYYRSVTLHDPSVWDAARQLFTEN